ncbi:MULTISPECIES: DUF4166 domain-containing protein [unclassified Microbacterium]|uniref:DUF4166 domain-containing protein n=1 Tax=unclassified Microbacterium TaxID=2609290 RepID=UPI000EA8ED8B|nr:MULTISPECIES: DUF4166 domain-containing protein [unclassified Microbacterium]MBT2486803.1 DUF4166 domain-containing protein [Microbacterium sp. ISL-108]RKN64728.1 DUF4166 domain-containing protein [Microbacterium sp. CGR2]
MTTENARGQVFLAALGADAERLHPEILAQLRAPGGIERAEGVFTVAGSRFGRWGALAVPVVGPQMLVTRFGRDVPFGIRTATGRTPDGRATLDTIREFRFPGKTQYIADRLTESAIPGMVRNILGTRGRVELIEECSVSDRGGLRMRTRRVALRLWGRRFALRGILGVSVDLEDGWDEESGRRTIEMRATNPVFGTVLEYRGWYRYIGRSEEDAPPTQ